MELLRWLEPPDNLQLPNSLGRCLEPMQFQSVITLSNILPGAGEMEASLALSSSSKFVRSLVETFKLAKMRTYWRRSFPGWPVSFPHFLFHSGFSHTHKYGFTTSLIRLQCEFTIQLRMARWGL